MPYTDEEWEEVSKELPSAKDDVVQHYLKARERLINQEQSKRSGMSPCPLHSSLLSAHQLEADIRRLCLP